MSFKVPLQHRLYGFPTSRHKIPIGTSHCLPPQYIINLSDILKTAEWVCQSVQNQCETHDIYNWFSLSSYFTKEEVFFFLLLHREKATKRGMWGIVELFCHQVGNYIQAQFWKCTFTFTHTYLWYTHTQKNLIWQDHCAKSPFSSLNMASSKKYLKHPGKVHRGRHKALHKRQPD